MLKNQFSPSVSRSNMLAIMTQKTERSAGQGEFFSGIVWGICTVSGPGCGGERRARERKAFLQFCCSPMNIVSRILLFVHPCSSSSLTCTDHTYPPDHAGGCGCLMQYRAGGRGVEHYALPLREDRHCYPGKAQTNDKVKLRHRHYASNRSDL